MQWQKLILNKLIAVKNEFAVVKNEFVVKWWSFMFIYSCKTEQNNKFEWKKLYIWSQKIQMLTQIKIISNILKKYLNMLKLIIYF